MPAKKDFLLLTAYTLYTKHVTFYLLLQITVSIYNFTVSALIFLTPTPYILIRFSAIPLLIISHIYCIQYTG
jgi:hypothetical protein